MKKFLSCTLIGFLMACGSINVEYDYDEQANFGAFKTYNYLPDIQSGLSELDLNRLTNATDSILQSLGYSKTENPTLLVNVLASQYEQASRSTIGIGVGGGGRGGGVGVSGGIPIGGRELHQTITIDLINAEKDILIWQAVSDSNIKLRTNPSEREAYFKKIMEKIFKKFPPQ